MEERNEQNIREQTPDELEKKRFNKFLNRLTIFRVPKVAARSWLAWAGVVLFVGLVIAYYLTGGAG